MYNKLCKKNPAVAVLGVHMLYIYYLTAVWEIK